MKDKESAYDQVYRYPKKEEKLNIYTHAFGIMLSIVATILLIVKAVDYPLKQGFSLVAFGISQIAIFSASTIYHSQTKAKQRTYWNITDHAMIFVSIAGTYTPICLITLKDDNGILLFGIVWGIAIIGMLFKIKFTGKYNLLSTLMYVAMGWLMVFYWKEIDSNMSDYGVNLIIAGGVSYSIGAILYMTDKIPYNHAMFHVFILLGSFCHFLCIYNYM